MKTKEDPFDYCACVKCDEGARWQCTKCGNHYCAKCSEAHTHEPQEPPDKGDMDGRD